MFACFWDSIRAPVNCLSLTPLAFYRRALSNSISLLDIPVHDASLLAERASYARRRVTLTCGAITIPRCNSFGRPNGADYLTRNRHPQYPVVIYAKGGQRNPLAWLLQ